MKKTAANLFYAFVFVTTISFHAHADYGIEYNFTQVAGTMVFNNSTAGSVSLIPGGADEQLGSFTVPSTWGGFYFGGVWYPQGATTVTVSTNGWLSISKPGDVLPSSPLPSNSLASNPYRMMAPLWDDLSVHANGEVSYKIVGGASNRTLVVEWRGMYWDHNATDTALSFQVVLFDNNQATIADRNVIEFRYKNNGAGSALVNNASGGASIGISGFCSTDVLAFQSSSGSVSKDAPEVMYLSSKPLDTYHHLFIPVGATNDECSNAGPFIITPSDPLLSGRYTQLQATQSPGPLPACGSPATLSDIWLQITKPAGITNFEIYTDSLDCRGVNYATGIALYSSCGSAAMTCDFGSAGPGNTNANSYLNMTNLPCTAQDYWARCYSADTSYRGYFRLNVRPPGRNCAFANDITPCGIPYTSPAGLSTCGFGNEYDSMLSEPHSAYMHGEDYVFSYTPPSDICLDFALNNTPVNSNPGLFIYQGCPDAGYCLGFSTGPGGSPLTFNGVSLTAGLTYYIVIDNDSTGGVPCLSDFDLEITIPSAGPYSYDICAAAQNIPVTVAQTCTGAIDFTDHCATSSSAGSIPLPGCGSFVDGVTPDVWFTFTSLSTSLHQIKVDPGSNIYAQDIAMAIYTGNCANMTLLNCDDNSNGMMPLLTVLPPSAGTTYYIRVWSNSGTSFGNFRICVSTGCVSANDLCTGAVPLTPGQYAPGDNSCATGINEPPVSATCWPIQSPAELNTVWYSFIATDDTMKVRIHLLTLFDSQMALYESTGGGCLGTFMQLACNDNALSVCGQSISHHSEMIAAGLTPGNTYYVVVDGSHANTGTFEIITLPVGDAYPPVYAQDCPLPVNVCNNNTMLVTSPAYQDEGNYCDVPPASGCLTNGELNSVFYTFSVTGTGAGTPVEFTISPETGGNFDFMLWCIDTVYNNGDQLPAVPNYCDNLMNQNMFPASVCNFSLQGITGCSNAIGQCPIPCYMNYSYYDPGMMPAVIVPNGMTATFLLLVNSNAYHYGFMLDWMGTPINGSPQSLIWQNANNSTWADSTNWNGGICGGVPDCANGIDAIIAGAGIMPIISVNTNVRNLTINTGASLSIAAGITLNVCGNLTNNGTLNCGVGSTVRFVGTTNTSINGIFSNASNNFYNLEIAKGQGASVTLNTDIFSIGTDSIHNGTLNCGGHLVEVGGNFYNYNGNISLMTAAPGTLTFTQRSGLPQHFRNDVAPAGLTNVTMDQLVAGSLTLDTNATSDLNIGPNGVLTLNSGKIITGPVREVNILNFSAASCNAGNISSYVEGNLRHVIAAGNLSYEFPVGDSSKGYQRFKLEFTQAPNATYNILGKFRPWTGMPLAGPTVSECGNNGWDLLPPFDNGYWTMDASTATGFGTYNAHAYPGAITNNTGASFSIMKSVSNNGLGPWLMEGVPFCAGTATHAQRNGLTTFSDFAVVQSDAGNDVSMPSSTDFDFLMTPNPTTGNINLSVSSSIPDKFRVFLKDVTGRNIFTAWIHTTQGTTSIDLDLRHISKGIYLVVLEHENGSRTSKLILQ